ncbi:MAG: hypothetical protein U9N79_01480 [Actinomycetota bacterium]|nr:hypothetical protein [Actinomycetota bacterium]
MAEANWYEAIRRWEEILDRFGSASSWSAYRGLIIAYTKIGSVDAAETMATRSRVVFPESVDLAVAQADLPMVIEDWPEAITRWNRLLDRFGPNVPEKVYVRLAIAQGKLGGLALATETLQRGRNHHPGNLNLIANSAELAMTWRDWPEAVRQWNELLQARAEAPDRPKDEDSFPTRGSRWDWYEEAWQTIVREWNRIEPELAFEPTSLLYRTLGKTLVRARMPEEGLDILGIGRIAHPEDEQLAFAYAVSHLGLQPTVGRAIGLIGLSKELQNHPRMAGFCADIAIPAKDATPPGHLGGDSDLGSVPSTCAGNLKTMADFAPTAVDTSDELGCVHVIRAPYGSSIELQLRIGRYFSPSMIRRRVREISERDAWEEMTSPENLMFKRARALADSFGRRFEDLPLLGAGALSDAVVFFIFEELCIYEPMRRLAADIAAESDDSPVFIESPTDSFRYVDGYSFSQFDVLYLHFELRKLGVNAFLVRYHAGRAPEQPKLEVLPGVRSLLPRSDVRETDQMSHRSALVPAGIRSVRRVVNTLDSPLVFSSGLVVKEFAFDRGLHQEVPIEPEATIHPPLVTLPTFTFDLSPTATLRGVALRSEEHLDPVYATIEVTREIGGDWMLWLDRALHDYLAGISTISVAEIAFRGIEEAHICDHLLADGVLFSDAVKQNGGRVVLWPHSANPVHVNERRPGSFDEVHAVTLSGGEQWRARFPDVQVTHSPWTMLDPPTRSTRIDANLPLSVVVIGGRSVLRYMPILDRSLHEASYRTFFTGLEDLQSRYPIDVYFKPRGHPEDNEMWLSATVGSTANWQRVLEHPLRIDLPNMLFVSISMGSSALLEGISRGIPGVVVRDFPVRDYTTLDEDTFPTGASTEMLDVIASCFEPGGYEQLLEHELDYYAAELETGEPL